MKQAPQLVRQIASTSRLISCDSQAGPSRLPLPLRTLRKRRRAAEQQRNLSGSQARFEEDCDDVSNKLREVMRNVAQPVAVVTALNTSHDSPSKYHGATLTSFTSLTLHPYPLVAFSLRLPSRLADCLRNQQDQPRMDGPATSPSPSPPSPIPNLSSDLPQSGQSGASRPSRNIPLTVSLLSHSNKPIATALSSRMPDQSEIFARPDWDIGSPPGLKSAVGTLRCEVVNSTPLRDMCGPNITQASLLGGASSTTAGVDAAMNPVPPDGTSAPKREDIETPAEHREPHVAAGSELFICRVLEVSAGSEEVAEKSLVYWKQKYAGVQDLVEENIEGL